MDKQLQFTVHPNLEKQGLKISAARFSVPSIPRRRGSGLEQHIKNVLGSLDIDHLLNSPILEEYRKLQSSAGIQKPIAPAEYLLTLIKRSGKLPSINRVVDAYNIASAETLLSMGAHDVTQIKGDLRLDITNGTELYVSLGKQEPEPVTPGEYAAMDDEKIICRLDLKQCNQTKCSAETTDFIVYAQGNALTSHEYVAEGLQKVCDNITQFCDGTYQMLT